MPSKQRVAGSSPAESPKTLGKSTVLAFIPLITRRKKGRRMFFGVYKKIPVKPRQTLFSLFLVCHHLCHRKGKREMSIRKINTKQLTAIKPIIKWGKKKFYFFVIIAQTCRRTTLESSPTQKQRRECCVSKLKKSKCLVPAHQRGSHPNWRH